MDNFPKKDIELKNRIRTNSYDLLEIAYEANNTQDIKYKKKLKRVLEMYSFLL